MTFFYLTKYKKYNWNQSIMDLENRYFTFSKRKWIPFIDVLNHSPAGFFVLKYTKKPSKPEWFLHPFTNAWMSWDLTFFGKLHLPINTRAVAGDSTLITLKQLT